MESAHGRVKGLPSLESLLQTFDTGKRQRRR
jgi:hypothetical protein